MAPIATLEAEARPRAARVPAPRPPVQDRRITPAGAALTTPDGAPLAPAPRTPAEAVEAVEAAAPPAAASPATAGTATETETETESATGAATAPARRRRLPQPPGRRAPLWLAALVAGALVAAVPGFFGSSPVRTVDASDYGLGVASDVGLSGGLDDAGVRRGITEAEARARLDELAASRAAREPKTVLPLSGLLTTCYCMRWGQMHYGLDLAAPLGTPIYSAADGVVLEAGPAPGFGNAVYIQDEDGNVHIYGHMRYYSVSAGDIVHAGDLIASVGNEGFSTGPHLHYEIHQGGRYGSPLDPQAWLADRDVHL